MIPYTYLIGWSKENIWYYGVRYSYNCNPNDLWKSYFTSSKHVKKFRKEYGEPDIIQVRRIFNSKESAIQWEHKVLRRMKVALSENWLNKNDILAPPVMIGENHPNYGKKWTKEQKEEQSKRLKNKLKGRSKSLEHRKKISEGLRNQSLSLRKKRSIVSRGEKNSNSVLTEDIVKTIIKDYYNETPKLVGKNKRETYFHLFSKFQSEKYNVSISTIKCILNNKIWKWIKKDGGIIPPS